VPTRLTNPPSQQGRNRFCGGNARNPRDLGSDVGRFSLPAPGNHRVEFRSLPGMRTGGGPVAQSAHPRQTVSRWLAPGRPSRLCAAVFLQRRQRRQPFAPPLSLRLAEGNFICYFYTAGPGALLAPVCAVASVFMHGSDASQDAGQRPELESGFATRFAKAPHSLANSPRSLRRVALATARRKSSNCHLFAGCSAH